MVKKIHVAIIVNIVIIAAAPARNTKKIIAHEMPTLRLG
jgi:hypothetical protein